MTLYPLQNREFDRFYALLEASFPADEYRPYEAQKAVLARPEYQILTNDAQDAMLTLWRFPTFAYLEHLVVAPGGRNRGLGSQLLQSLLSGLTVPLVLEAEPPETELARRRLGFYQRNGFFIHPYPYEQPPYGPGRSPVPLKVLSNAPMNPEEFRTVRDTLYRQVYGVK